MANRKRDGDDVDSFGELLEAWAAAEESENVADAQRIAVTALASVPEAQDHESKWWLAKMAAASDCESSADWTGAERIYTEILQRAEESCNHWNAYKAHEDLAGLYSLCGKQELVGRELERAVESARKDQSKQLLTMSLQSLAAWRNRTGDHLGGLEVVNELLDHCTNDRLSGLSRSRAQITRAACLIELNKLDDAEVDLSAAYTYLEPQQHSRFLAGVQSALSSYWLATARLRTRRNDNAGALAALERHLGFQRILASLPHIAGPHIQRGLANALRRYAESLRTCGKDKASEKAANESRSILRALGLDG